MVISTALYDSRTAGKSFNQIAFISHAQNRQANTCNSGFLYYYLNMIDGESSNNPHFIFIY